MKKKRFSRYRQYPKKSGLRSRRRRVGAGLLSGLWGQQPPQPAPSSSPPATEMSSAAWKPAPPLEDDEQQPPPLQQDVEIPPKAQLPQENQPAVALRPLGKFVHESEDQRTERLKRIAATERKARVRGLREIGVPVSSREAASASAPEKIAALRAKRASRTAAAEADALDSEAGGALYSENERRKDQQEDPMSSEEEAAFLIKTKQRFSAPVEQLVPGALYSPDPGLEACRNRNENDFISGEPLRNYKYSSLVVLPSGNCMVRANLNRWTLRKDVHGDYGGTARTSIDPITREPLYAGRSPEAVNKLLSAAELERRLRAPHESWVRDEDIAKEAHALRKRLAETQARTVIKKWPSVTNAARHFGVPPAAILAACQTGALVPRPVPAPWLRSGKTPGYQWRIPVQGLSFTETPENVGLESKEARERRHGKDQQRAQAYDTDMQRRLETNLRSSVVSRRRTMDPAKKEETRARALKLLKDGIKDAEELVRTADSRAATGIGTIWREGTPEYRPWRALQGKISQAKARVEEIENEGSGQAQTLGIPPPDWSGGLLSATGPTERYTTSELKWQLQHLIRTAAQHGISFNDGNLMKGLEGKSDEDVMHTFKRVREFIQNPTNHPWLGTLLGRRAAAEAAAFEAEWRSDRAKKEASVKAAEGKAAAWAERQERKRYTSLWDDDEEEEKEAPVAASEEDPALAKYGPQLPYGGNLQEAMRAQDRNAMKVLMRHQQQRTLDGGRRRRSRPRSRKRAR